LTALLQGTGQPPVRPLFWHFPHYTNQGGKPAGAIRDGDWKLVEQYEDGSVELYNLARDFGETTNLANQQPERAAELRSKLRDWRQRVGAQTNTANLSFDAILHRGLYEAFDASRFDPAKANAAEWKRADDWRRQMDAVVPKGKP